MENQSSSVKFLPPRAVVHTFRYCSESCEAEVPPGTSQAFLLEIYSILSHNLGKRKRGRQKKRWKDNIKKWTGMDFGIPIPLYNQNVLLWCFVYSFLELLVEVVDLTVIMTRCWCINLYDGDIERSFSQAD